MMYIRNEMKEMGFGAGDYPFIAFVFLEEGLSQDELSRRMRVDKSYTARALAKLEKMEMIERRNDPDEHRVKRVYSGKACRKMADRFFQMLMEWQLAMVEDIDSDDLKVITSGMDRMIRNAELKLGLEPNPPI